MFPENKKKEKKRLDEEYATYVRFHQQMEDALRVPDPIKKLFKLEKVKADIGTEINRLEELARSEASKKEAWMLFGGNAASIGLAVGLTMTTGFLPFMLVAMPGTIASSIASDKYKKTAQQALRERNMPFVWLLNEMKESAETLSDRVLESHLEAVAKSEKRKELFDAFPDLKTRFADVAAKKIENNGLPPPKPAGDPPKFEF